MYLEHGRIHCIYPNRAGQTYYVLRLRKVFDFWICHVFRKPCVIVVKLDMRWRISLNETDMIKSSHARVRTQMVSIALLAFISTVQHIWYTQTNPRPPHPATCPPTVQLRGLGKGEQLWAYRDPEKIAWHVSHLSPAHLLHFPAKTLIKSPNFGQKVLEPDEQIGTLHGRSCHQCMNVCVCVIGWLWHEL